MAVQRRKPTSAGRRFQSVSDFSEITKSRPERQLTVPLPSTGGRNSYGRKTARHRGGGHKRQYRIIDFWRDKDGIPAKVAAIEYDPNRNARIALLHYVDGEKRYILAPEKLAVGDMLQSGQSAEIRVGNALPLRYIPVGSVVHNVELRPGGGGKMARGAGMSIQLVAKEGMFATLRLPSGIDPFQICGQWSTATAEIVPGGLITGMDVLPLPHWQPATLAAQAATVSILSGGRFILGVGAGSIGNERFRHSFNIPDYSPIKMTHDYVVTLRRLLAGEEVTYEGHAVTLRGVRLAVKPPRTPVYLAALGPRMLRLAAREADGVALNWATVEHIAACRAAIADAAREAGRKPADVKVAQYVRVAVDHDENRARRAIARATIDYAMVPPGAPSDRGQPGQFRRIGFADALADLEARRDRGASIDELVDAFPTDLLRRVAYFGPASGAAAALRKLSTGLDTAIVRIVPTRPGIGSVLTTMRACRPELV